MEKNFKKNLRDELDYLGITVKELSSQTGIAKGTLDCYLGARSSMPPADIAVKIANALGVSVEYLITGKEINKEKISIAFNHNIRSILQTIGELNNNDHEIILGLARVLKKQSEKGKN